MDLYPNSFEIEIQLFTRNSKFLSVDRVQNFHANIVLPAVSPGFFMVRSKTTDMYNKMWL